MKQLAFRFLPLFALLALLGACSAPAVAVADEEAGRGGGSPEQVVDSFVESLNLALRDPSLNDPNVRRTWSERLASYFAPSERVDQRTVFAGMLSRFATTAQQPFVGERVSLEIIYTRTEVIAQDERSAEVSLVDGTIELRWLDDSGNILRGRSSNLMDLIGGGRAGLPVLRVGNQWFLTEG
ncbi:MAG: hypothetical protein HC822_05725 [Oscillochloris sp.]|nr:hypothetical protein [Oscillochloris sp.]